LDVFGSPFEKWNHQSDSFFLLLLILATNSSRKFLSSTYILKQEMESSNNKRKADEIDAPAPKRQHTNVIAREPSIFGVKPVDDVTKYIADFIAEHCQLENVEVCGLSLSDWCY